MSRTALALGLAGVVVALSPALPSAAWAQTEITGAGSSFAAPIYGKWAEASSPTTGIKLNYQAIGSGGGINQINNRTVDFGASDMPLTADKLSANKLMQFPTVIGGVDIIVNLPDIKPNELKLTGPMLAQIYMGKITKWNDPAIAAVNPGLKLPGTAIAPVHRADGSGTTFVFTDYLSQVSSDWKSQIGAATSVNWPGGAGAKGSDGVAASVRQIRGAIGYVESAYAEQNKLTTTMLQNQAGKFVAPTMDTFQAAAKNADWSKVQNFAIDLNDQPGADSWPIVSATFVLVPTDPKDEKRSAAVLTFFDWGFTHGDDIAKQLLYVPLPAKVHDAVRVEWKKSVPGAK
ncbi:phosphate ABC transporter substrate-binding protein PstS [Rhodopila sp.]|uniref:phosphate ABC transporter substrate-binding protein PstS n=1 Tax=Rhodopila sp. TaxID=2480087 RepID=UPI002B596227|nr:phosphate ABC transporter substrate-binding protein PstS [Rhodopila sp.]HVZ09378.1 phosphate ABC transporter substrate-binding protein PstS [Rhodopila sp.]